MYSVKTRMVEPLIHGPSVSPETIEDGCVLRPTQRGCHVTDSQNQQLHWTAREFFVCFAVFEEGCDDDEVQNDRNACKHCGGGVAHPSSVTREILFEGCFVQRLVLLHFRFEPWVYLQFCTGLWSEICSFW
jgi:hypothetical protein